MNRVILRNRTWRVRGVSDLGSRKWLQLEDPYSGEQVDALCPPDEFEVLAEPAAGLDRRSLTSYAQWRTLHQAVALQAVPKGMYAGYVAGRISPERYQFEPLRKLLSGPRRGILIADDVGLGKTVETGICLLELIARGVGRRILIVVPPGLIPQWLDEMWDKFGLKFHSIENSAALDRAQTVVAEGTQPWAYFDRVITSTEYLKRKDVHAAALAHPWDVVVIDEAHYLAESGTPANPYGTARTRLGPKLRQASRSLILLTATPHNGYSHSFRSLLELVEPADATLHGRREDVLKRVSRNMTRRLKHQIFKTGPDGKRVPAFPPRKPVEAIEVGNLLSEEKEVFGLVSAYCAKTLSAADEDKADVVSFAMQIVKKRMLSSRLALRNTVENRLKALGEKEPEEPPKQGEIRELFGDLPVSEAEAERTALRLLRTAVSRDVKRRNAEKKQLKAIAVLLDKLAPEPDPKIAALIANLETGVIAHTDEKAIIFTEYRDTLAALKEAFDAHPQLKGAYVELTGGLSPRQRKQRIARFHEDECRVLLATDAASEGLNLQEKCRQLYHFELPWNPNRLEQRNGRIDRHGQLREPIIRYLMYPDSPEDTILDKLVRRIANISNDRVATPDILGIFQTTRVESVLTGIESMAEADQQAGALLKEVDKKEHEFSTGMGALMFSEESQSPYGDNHSADAVLGDDLPFEQTIIDVLREGLTPGQINETWALQVPRYLQGAGVASSYASVTFRRSVAVAHPADLVEYIHRLHPLAKAIAEYAAEKLTLEPARNHFAMRIAARRSAHVKEPVAIFSFQEFCAGFGGQVFSIGFTAKENRLDDDHVARIENDAALPGEVDWSMCETAFGAFAELQAMAGQTAKRHVENEVASRRVEASELADRMHEEAAQYRIDRLAEIDVEEKAEKAGSKDQYSLFRTVATNWDARRAGVETHFQTRLKEIERFVQIPDPADPQPLGVLLVFPVS